MLIQIAVPGGGFDQVIAVVGMGAKGTNPLSHAGGARAPVYIRLPGRGFQPLTGKLQYSRRPLSIQDQRTLIEAKRGGGIMILPRMNDARFSNMQKWQCVSHGNNGGKSTVHYLKDPVTGKLMDFKFTAHSHTGVAKQQLIPELGTGVKGAPPRHSHETLYPNGIRIE